MEIKVLGSGCRYCALLERHTRQALERLGVEASIEKVTDLPEIMSYGVMSTPALVVDGTVVASGKVPSPRQLTDLIGSAAART
jgi:small redox-active disulfide protein 2